MKDTVITSKLSHKTLTILWNDSFIYLIDYYGMVLHWVTIIMNEKLLQIWFFKRVFYSETNWPTHILARANIVLLVHWKNSCYLYKNIYILCITFMNYLYHLIIKLMKRNYVKNRRLILSIASSVNSWHWNKNLSFVFVWEIGRFSDMNEENGVQNQHSFRNLYHYAMDNIPIKSSIYPS